MKNVIKTLAAVLAALALGSFLSAKPSGPGIQHIRYTGIEEILVPPAPGSAPGSMVFTVKKTISIPRLRVDELVLYVEYSYYEEPFPDGSFRMHGVGTIMDDQWEMIGVYSFSNVGMYLTPPPLVDMVLDGLGVGTIWAGPLRGIAMTENVSLEGQLDFSSGIPVGTRYDSLQEGFLLVPRFVDMKELKTGLADFTNHRCRRGRR